MTQPSRIPDSLHRLHEAKDGHTAIVRFLGGRVSATQWSHLAELASGFGDGSLHLTSRAAVQLRGIADPQGFKAALRENAALPVSESSPQILASERVDEHLLAQLGQCAEATSFDRLLIGIDDGRGDTLIHRPDFGFVLSGGATHVIIGGAVTDLTTNDPAATLTQLLQLWGEHNTTSSRTLDQRDFIARATDQLHQRGHSRATTPCGIELPHTPPVGWMQDGDTVTLGLGVPLATIDAKIATILGAIGARTTITGWPSLLIHDLSEGDAEAVAKVLAPQGLVFDAASPWLRVTSCVGIQGCSHALSDVRTDAQQLASTAELDGRTHFSGCGRRCGRPADTTTDYIAIGDGEYEVEETN